MENKIRDSAWVKIMVNMARPEKERAERGEVFDWCKANSVSRLEFIFVEQVIFEGDARLWGPFIHSEASRIFLRDIRPHVAVMVLKYEEQIERRITKSKSKKKVQAEAESMTFALWPKPEK